MFSLLTFLFVFRNTHNCIKIKVLINIFLHFFNLSFIFLNLFLQLIKCILIFLIFFNLGSLSIIHFSFKFIKSCLTSIKGVSKVVCDLFDDAESHGKCYGFFHQFFVKFVSCGSLGYFEFFQFQLTINLNLIKIILYIIKLLCHLFAL